MAEGEKKKNRVFTALVSPFDGNGAVNINGLKENVIRQINGGVDGVVVLGTTGESCSMVARERKDVVKTVVETCNGRIPCVVGTGSNCTAKTIDDTNDACNFGADYALVVAPYYNCPTQDGIYRHFQEISRECSIKVIVYNVPKRCGVNIDPDTMDAITSLANVVAIKECNFSQMARVVNLCSKNGADIFCGDDVMMLPAMSLGACGLVSVVSNLLPTYVVNAVNCAAESNFDKARKLFFDIFPVIEALSIETNPIPVKYGMEIMGMPAGNCRLPLGVLSSKNKLIVEEKIKLWLKEIIT